MARANCGGAYTRSLIGPDINFNILHHRKSDAGCVNGTWGKSPIRQSYGL